MDLFCNHRVDGRTFEHRDASGERVVLNRHPVMCADIDVYADDSPLGTDHFKHRRKKKTSEPPRAMPVSTTSSGLVRQMISCIAIRSWGYWMTAAPAR